MDLIRKLIAEKYALLNVKETKAPVHKDWETKTADQLQREYNMNSRLWGMRMGKQDNGHYIMSLDFDACGKADPKTKERLGCEYTKKKLAEYCGIADVEDNGYDGFFDSSTDGNANVLIDYTDAPEIRKMVEEIGSKFKVYELEVLLGNGHQQVIPPTLTQCKRRGEKWRPRMFATDEPFYIMTEQSPIYDFVLGLFADKHNGVGQGKENKKENKIQPIKTNEIEECDINLTGCDTDIKKLLEIIGSARCGPQKYDEWVGVAQIIKNETKDEGLNDFVNWTIKYGTDKKKKNAITKYQTEIRYTPKHKTRLGIKTLHYWARIDNPQAYRIAFPSEKQTDIVIEPDMADKFKLIDPIIASPADYAIAFAYNKIYDGLQKCVDRQRKEFYCFDEKSKLWNFDVGGTPIRNRISTEFHAIFEKYIQVKQNDAEMLDPNSKECEINKKMVKSMGELMIRLQKTNDKNNIMTELGDICKDVKFPSTLNRCEYLMPTNDGMVLDMLTLKLTDRTINHNFSFVCDAKLIPYDATHEHFIKAKDYFDELFCGNKDTIKCVINILKSVFIGRPLRYIYFCIGVGSNGKSLLFKILNKIFGDFMDVISQNVIIQQKGNKSALNTEVEKLDKCRVGYITEVKESDDLNEIVIKQITGGDAINLRTLHTKDHTINPTCNTFVLTNEFPKFNGDAVSMQNRMIAIPFKKIFAVKDGFEAEMLEISDYIFSYIMHTGVICDKFDLSTEMVEEMEKHRKNNTETALADYMKIRFADCENNKTTNKLILVNDVRVDFLHYCDRYKITNTISTRKFPAKMRELGYNVKESNSKLLLYGKKFIDIVVPDVPDVEVPKKETEDNTDGEIDNE